MRLRQASWPVAVSMILLLGCGAPGSEQSVIAQVDAADASCSGVQDPILLANLFGLGGNWIKAQTADLVAAEIGRESHPQDRVIVDLPVIEIEVISVRPKDEVVLSMAITVREDRFDRLEIASSLGGPVYVQLFKQGKDRPSSAKGMVWIDSVGDIHFLGDCAPFYWTEPMGRFAGSIGWQGTQEELLLALINREPEFEALKQWTFGPPEPKWADLHPEERHLFDAPNRQLEDLVEPGFLIVSIPDSWLATNTLLCTFVPDAGWNPCIPLTEDSQFGSPVEIDTYHVPGDPIEVWLRDADDESTRTMIGLVTFEPGENTAEITLIDPAPSVRDSDGLLLDAAQQEWMTADPVP